MSAAGDEAVLVELLRAWAGVFGERPVALAEVVERPELRPILLRVAVIDGEPATAKLVGLLTRHDGQSLGGWCVRKDTPSKAGRATWRIAKAAPPSAGAGAPDPFAALLAAWHRALGDKPTSLRGLIAAGAAHPALAAALASVAGASPVTPPRVAQFILRRRHLEVSGLRLDSGAGVGAANWWRVVPASGQAPAPPERAEPAEWTVVSKSGAGVTRTLAIQGGTLVWHVARVAEQVVGGLVFVPAKPE